MASHHYTTDTREAKIRHYRERIEELKNPRTHTEWAMLRVYQQVINNQAKRTP